MKSADRDAAYIRTLEFRDLAKAGSAIYDGHSILRKQAIFITEDLEKTIYDALMFYGSARAARSVEFEVGNFPGALDATKKFLEEGPAVLEELKKKVRSRLMENICR